MKQSMLLVATLLLGVLAGLGITVAQTQGSLAQTAVSTKPNMQLSAISPLFLLKC